ncbi:MAG: type III secretion system inner rod subunit SctI [Deltaproteobacteria bacterium]|nr:type III secretion system inner rod subunit SctI [Deltaproteobacteria bacterium]
MIPDVEGTCHRVRPIVSESIPAPDGRTEEHSSGVSFRSVLIDLREAERETDAWVDKALGGRVTDPQEMLRLQVVVSRFQVQVELAAKVVDQISQAVRTLTRGGS